MLARGGLTTKGVDGDLARSGKSGSGISCQMSEDGCSSRSDFHGSYLQIVSGIADPP